VKYIVYQYQYNDMKAPRWGAVQYRNQYVWDLLPPVVIQHTAVEAKTKREAIRLVKGAK
jgi:hypothetical protein